MTDAYHYPPDVFALLVDTIPVLCRSKNDVLIFFRGAGTPERFLEPLAKKLRNDRESINKFDISRSVLQHINEAGDATLAVRREVIKRVVEFEDFSTCWPADQMKAKGLVSEIRRVVNVKDSFTRMKNERDTEKARTKEGLEAERTAARERRENIARVRDKLFALFAMDDKPHERGVALEEVLNDLFKTYGVLIRENFRRRDPDSATVVEQLDGVIVLDGKVHLVEMKWLKDPVGMAEFSPHLVRLFSRADASGIFISNSSYTEAVVTECGNALGQKTLFLCTLEEFVELLRNEADLLNMLRKKSHAAIVEKRPFFKVV